MAVTYLFCDAGGDERWLLPLSWSGKKIACRAVGDGAVAPAVVVTGRELLLTGMAAGVPVVLTV